MKNPIYTILVIVLLAMFVSNTSEADFLTIIDSHTDPLSEHWSLRSAKNSKAIFDPPGYYSPVFDMTFINLGLFSYAKIEHGWMGNLRRDGAPLGESVDKVTEASYLLIFGMEFLLEEESNF